MAKNGTRPALAVGLLLGAAASDAPAGDGDRLIVCDEHGAIVDGDALEPAISAASILAKTARDEAMLDLHRQYPQYGFDRHMGYPTADHLERLRQHGPSPIHRRSFGPVKLLLAQAELF